MSEEKPPFVDREKNPLKLDMPYCNICIVGYDSIGYITKLEKDTFTFCYQNGEKARMADPVSFAYILKPLSEDQILKEINLHSQNVSKLQRGLTLLAQTPPKSTGKLPGKFG